MLQPRTSAGSTGWCLKRSVRLRDNLGALLVVFCAGDFAVDHLFEQGIEALAFSLGCRGNIVRSSGGVSQSSFLACFLLLEHLVKPRLDFGNFFLPRGFIRRWD